VILSALAAWYAAMRASVAGTSMRWQRLKTARGGVRAAQDEAGGKSARFARRACSPQLRRTDVLHLLQVVVVLARAGELVLALVEAARCASEAKRAITQRVCHAHMDSTRCRILFSAASSMPQLGASHARLA